MNSRTATELTEPPVVGPRLALQALVPFLHRIDAELELHRRRFSTPVAQRQLLAERIAGVVIVHVDEAQGTTGRYVPGSRQ